jgi:hypothetical protein
MATKLIAPRWPLLGLVLLLGGCGAGDRYARLYPADRAIILCYRTLADSACYDRPDPGRDGQLLGFYLRPVDDPLAKSTALAAAKARL